MRDIKGYDTFAKIEPLNKGWSSDKKYTIETADGRRLLLRVSDISEYDRKKTEFEMMQRVAAFGVPMSQPVDFGVCDGGKSVYQLLSWIDGEDAEVVLPILTETEQYTLGLEAGKLLKKMQALSAAQPSSEWMKGYGAKLLRYIQNYRNCGLTFEGDELLIQYITEHIHLMDNRPTCFTHDDYHPGNMILTPDKKLFIIDFQRFRNVEPFHAMSGLVFSAKNSPHFATGQVHGYFEGEPPADFWELLSLYMAVIAVNALPWSIPFGQGEIDFAYRQIADILVWFDNMQNPVPTWYLKEWQALGLAQNPQSWMVCDESVRRYIIGLIDLFKHKLNDNLVGVYLHGSLATSSYFPPKSDIDLIIVVKQSIESNIAKELNLSIAKYAEACPTVGSIELSVITIKTALTTPFEMPYELHYSESWHQRVLDDQVEYGNQPIDPDLQAHLRCVKNRGICLYGKPINEVFGEVKWQSFMAAILDDFDWIAEGKNICESPYYGVLNICRVLQALRENNQKELSKFEGAVWGLRNLPHEHRPLIRDALIVYASNVPICENERKTGGVVWDKTALLAFRDYAKDVREKCTQQNYRNNPCGSCSTAYWKEKYFAKPEGIRVIHGIDEARCYDVQKAKRYFRLIYRFDTDYNSVLPKGYSFHKTSLPDDCGQIAEFINRCYEGYALTEADILRWTKYPVFDTDLWVFIFDDASNTPVALGIADYDASIREGSLEWVQVLPENRGMGLGKAVVNELLTRMKEKADFVTVSGECDNPTNPETLYRKCGFNGNDIWYVFREEAAK